MSFWDTITGNTPGGPVWHGYRIPSASNPTGYDPSGSVGQAIAQLGFGPASTGPFGTNAYNAPMSMQQIQQAMGGVQGSSGAGSQNLQGLYSQLQAQANGQGPNMGAQVARQSGQQNQQQAMGMVAGNRSLSPGLAARLAGQQFTQQGAASNMNAANIGLQQQLAATSQMGQVAGQQQQNQQFNAAQQNAMLQQM